MSVVKFPGKSQSGASSDGGGGGVEARIARLESDVEHIKTTLADIKVELRATRDSTSAEIGSLRNDLGSLRSEHAADYRSLRDKMDTEFRWVLLAFSAGFMTLLGAMAKGFGWL